jgi:hypothetical protein
MHISQQYISVNQGTPVDGDKQSEDSSPSSSHLSLHSLSVQKSSRMSFHSILTHFISHTLIAMGSRTQSGKLIYKVVLTGGPCGGKTTGQDRLASFFETLGWKVFRVPETATILINGGVKYVQIIVTNSTTQIMLGSVN